METILSMEQTASALRNIKVVSSKSNSGRVQDDSAFGASGLENKLPNRVAWTVNKRVSARGVYAKRQRLCYDGYSDQTSDEPVVGMSVD
jgi:hypothetical protein